MPRMRCVLNRFTWQELWQYAQADLPACIEPPVQFVVRPEKGLGRTIRRAGEGNRLVQWRRESLDDAVLMRHERAPLRVGFWTRKVSGARFRKRHASNYLNLLTVIGTAWESGERVFRAVGVTTGGQRERAHHTRGA